MSQQNVCCSSDKDKCKRPLLFTVVNTSSTINGGVLTSVYSITLVNRGGEVTNVTIADTLSSDNSFLSDTTGLVSYNPNPFDAVDGVLTLSDFQHCPGCHLLIRLHHYVDSI